MKLDEKRLNRQLAIVDKWVRNQAIGALEAGTGFGKTMVAILAIKRLHNKYPQAKIIVVLPSTKLCEDWLDKDKGHIAIHNLSNVQAFVVNTYITTYHQCDLLVLDEIQTMQLMNLAKSLIKQNINSF